jgi:hypothetical protein
VTGLALSIGFAAHWFNNRQEVPLRLAAESVKDVVVTLRVVPASASVLLDGEPIGPPDKHGILRVSVPGDEAAAKWLEVSAGGYHSIKRPVSVFAGSADATINLVRKPFELAIKSDPPQAEIWINGVLKGVSPTSITAEAGDDMVLLLKRPGFADYAKQIQPPADGERVELNLQMTPLSTVVDIDTVPPGADIIVAGTPRGTSPLKAGVEVPVAGELEILARKNGYEQARTVLTIDKQSAGTNLRADLTLAPAAIRVRMVTNPPGGKISMDGEELGTSPVEAKFERSQAGHKVLLTGAKGKMYRGQLEYTVPEADVQSRSDSPSVKIPMLFSGERLAFVLCPRAPTGGDYKTLLDQFAEEIHHLGGDQHFAVIAAGDEEPEKWPAESPTQAGTTEQKVRAYDMIRSVRPAKDLRLTKALNMAMTIKPSSVFIFTGSDLNRAELTKFGEVYGDNGVQVHIVSIIGSEQDEWLAAWSQRLGGSFSLLGRDPLPALAAGASDD